MPTLPEDRKPDGAQARALRLLRGRPRFGSGPAGGNRSLLSLRPPISPSDSAQRERTVAANATQPMVKPASTAVFSPR